MGVSRNGNLRYVNYSNFYLTNEIPKVINEDNDIVIYDTMGISDLLGNAKLDVLNLNIGVHHDVIRKKSDSNYIMLANSQWGVEDRICEVDSNGNLIRDLYVGDLIKKIVNKNGNEAEKEYLKKLIFDEDNKYYSIGRKKDFPMDWAHCNSLVYDEGNDILYMSVRSLAVMAVDYSEWELIWYMADDTLDTMESYNPYGRYLKDLKSFDPYKVLGDGNTDGPKSQHALFLVSTNVIGMFDNQGDEDINPNGSRYVEYKITGSHGSWKAEKVYEYKTENKLYPKKLKNILDPPVCFYIKGNKEILNKDSVGIVGSRTAFKSSLEFSREISKRFSENGINVVSGLARGVDKFAHLGSLDSNSPPRKNGMLSQ